MRDEQHLIPEVEVSLTAACTLACAHCGFFVPQQPLPALGNVVAEFADALACLERNAIRIGSLALLGGEATLVPAALVAALRLAASSEVVGRVEVVTNGLSPKGLPEEALQYVDRLSLSDYTADDTLADRWRSWLLRAGPGVEFVVRRHGSWDRFDDVVDLGVEGGQAAYETCWYRRHCVTLERRRIFVCSRIPKLGADEQGLELAVTTTREEILGYLQAQLAPKACRTCTPLAGLPKIEPGQQPDERLVRLRRHALAWFEREEATS